jgi:hypothetical protein
VDPDAVFVDPAASAKPAKTPVANDPPRCADWRKRMTAEQRTTYSAALLRAAWQNEGSSATPPETSPSRTGLRSPRHAPGRAGERAGG